MGGVVGDIASFASGGLAAVGLKRFLFDGSEAPAAAKIAAPPPPPDPTDEAVQRARLAARRRVMSGQGTGGTFISGPLGDGSGASGGSATLSGY